MNKPAFKSERISRTATINLKADIKKVFPLFDPIEEGKWVDGWEYKILYPVTESLEEGMVFMTPGNGKIEKNYTWIVSKYQPEDYFVEYIVSTINRCWVIKIQCDSVSNSRTKATITYIYTGLNSLGNKINRQKIEKMYQESLKDWESAINYFLKTEKVFKYD